MVRLLLAAPPLLLIIGLFVLFATEPVRALPRLDLAPSFRLSDAGGRPVTSEALLGSVVLYSFVGAECDEACTAALALARAVEPEVTRDWAVPVRLVTVVVEPVDSATLQQVATATGASSGQWLVVGGDETAVRLVRQGFAVPVATGADGRSRVEPVLVLVDPAGIVRAVYRTPLPPADVLRDDLTVLQDELASAQGAKRYVYEALHLFTCSGW